MKILAASRRFRNLDVFCNWMSNVLSAADFVVAVLLDLLLNAKDLCAVLILTKETYKLIEADEVRQFFVTAACGNYTKLTFLITEKIFNLRIAVEGHLSGHEYSLYCVLSCQNVDGIRSDQN